MITKRKTAKPGIKGALIVGADSADPQMVPYCLK